MNPINFVVTQAYGGKGLPNSARVKGTLLRMLPLTILVQGKSLAESLEAVKSSINEQNSAQRLRVVLPESELVTEVMKKALELKKFDKFKEYASSDLGQSCAHNIAESLARDESLSALETLAVIAPEMARAKLALLFQGAVIKQIQEQEGFELDSPLSEIAQKIPNFDPDVYSWIQGSVTSSQFSALGQSEKVPEPYKALFAVIGELTDSLENEITLPRFESVVAQINNTLTAHGDTVLISTYKKVAAQLLIAVAQKVEPLLAEHEVNTHNDEQLREFNALKDSIQNAGALLGAEIKVEREMQTDDDQFIAAFLGMGYSPEEIGSWLQNPPEDQLLFTLWVTSEGNTRIEEDSIRALYNRFKGQSNSSPNVELLSQQGFLFIGEPTPDAITEWANGKEDIEEFITWHIQNANVGNIFPGATTLDEYYALFRAVNLA